MAVVNSFIGIVGFASGLIIGRCWPRVWPITHRHHRKGRHA
jgi:hypothetical protein